MNKKQLAALVAGITLDLVERLHPGEETVTEEQLAEARTLLGLALRKNREALLDAVCVQEVEVVPVFGPAS